MWDNESLGTELRERVAEPRGVWCSTEGTVGFQGTLPSAVRVAGRSDLSFEQGEH